MKQIPMKSLVREEIARLNQKIEKLIKNKKSHTKSFRQLMCEHKKCLHMIGYGS